MKGQHTFSKSEKLKSLKVIKELFKKSSSFYLYPFRILILPENAGLLQNASYPKVLLSVPKKNFRKAVHRNKIKRLIKEVYRLQKPFLPKTMKSAYAIGFIYVGKEIHDFAFLQKRFSRLLEQIDAENLS